MAEIIELSVDKSQEQAEIIKALSGYIQILDADYLREALAQMREKHNFRDAAMILNPNPHTHSEKQKVNELKLQQLDLLLKMRENVDASFRAQLALMEASQNQNNLSKLFGF